jgi:hypothetical protein
MAMLFQLSYSPGRRILATVLDSPGDDVTAKFAFQA